MELTLASGFSSILPSSSPREVNLLSLSRASRICNFDLPPSNRRTRNVENRNLFHWNALISALSKNERWDETIYTFYEMISTTDLLPDNFTLPCVLRACGEIFCVEVGRQIHGVSFKTGLFSDTFVCNSLISMYARCRCTKDATLVFDGMPHRNVISWNTMLRGFSEAGFFRESVNLFQNLLFQEETLQLDDATIVSILPICGSESMIELGWLIHALALKLGLFHLPRVFNSLLDMYCKCGRVTEAELLFREIHPKNKITWNIMIRGLARNGEALKTLILLREMVASGESVDEITLLNVSSACSNPAMTKSLKELHGYALRKGFLFYELLFNALITAYCKCGFSMAAEKLFFMSLSSLTVSSWNALIGGHAQNGDPEKALKFHLQMVSSGLKPDKFSVGSILSALALIKDLQGGRSVHGFIYRSFLHEDPFVVISLLSLYIQCGEMDVAEIIFPRMEEKGSVAWNAMISGMAQNRLPHEALRYFRLMMAEHRQFSAITAAASFSAAGQISALKLGQELHCQSLKSGDQEDSFVSSSAVDMYAKCGNIDDARKLFDTIKNKNVVSWNVMIMGYGVHGRGSDAIELLRIMERKNITPDYSTFLSVLSACSHAGMIEIGFQVFEEMKTKHGMEPKMEHVACMADMLARAGRVDEAAELVIEPDQKFLSSLLGACRKYGNLKMGEEIAEKLLTLEEEKAETFVLASNLYAANGRWEDVGRLRKRMREMGLKKEVGHSWIHVDEKMHEFFAGEL